MSRRGFQLYVMRESSQHWPPSNAQGAQEQPNMSLFLYRCPPSKYLAQVSPLAVVLRGVSRYVRHWSSLSRVLMQYHSITSLASATAGERLELSSRAAMPTPPLLPQQYLLGLYWPGFGLSPKEPRTSRRHGTGLIRRVWWRPRSAIASTEMTSSLHLDVSVRDMRGLFDADGLGDILIRSPHYSSSCRVPWPDVRHCRSIG